MSGGRPGGRRREAALFVLKLGIGLALLCVLCFWRGTGREALRHLAGFQWPYVVLLLVLAQVQNLISCVKWQLFLRHQGHRVSLMRLWALYLIGRFFSNFLPSMVGGDLTRMVLLGREIGSQSRSAASVFWERFTGLIAMIGVAVVFSLAHRGIYREPLVAAALAASVVAAVVLVALMGRPLWLTWAVGLLGRLPGGKRPAALLVKIHEEIVVLCRERQLMARAMAWSVLFHLMAGVFTYAACVSIGFHPPLLSVIVITPIILMLNNLPVSPNNVGWWEWSFTIMMTQAGGAPAQGLGVALVLRATAMLSSMAGGVLFMMERPRKAAAGAAGAEEQAGVAGKEGQP